MKKDGTLYLLHIIECTDRITRYTRGGKEVFLTDEMVQDAVLRNLQILAESTQRLGEDLKVSHPEIDWHGIAGFRNILGHQYLSRDRHHPNPDYHTSALCPPPCSKDNVPTIAEVAAP